MGASSSRRKYVKLFERCDKKHLTDTCLMISLETKAMMQVTTRLLEARQTIYDL